MNRYFKTLYLAAVAIFLLFVNVQAQEGAIRLPHITTEDGLSLNQTTRIFQDDKGFIWLGTYNGLNRYDGFNFKTFLPETNNPNSISSHHITAILQDSRGIIWIGTNHGLNKYDFKTESFTRYLNDPNNTSSISHDLVYSIFEDNSGTLWIGTHNALNKYDRENDNFSQLKIRIGDSPNSSSKFSNIQSISCMLQDYKGNIWLGTWDGLTCMQPDGKILKQYFTEERSTRTMSYKSISSIYEDNSKALWIGTNGGGIQKLNQQTGKFTLYNFLSRDTNSISNNYINVIFQDKTGDLWFGTKNGLNKYNPQKDNFTRVLNDPQKPLSIINNEILSIYEDKTGLLWVGTAGGISRFHKPFNEFFYYQVNSKNSSLGLSNNNVTSVYIDREQNLWIGTYDGLNKKERGSNSFIHFRNDPSNKNSISDNYIMSVWEDSEGYIWVGTNQMGLNRINPETGENKLFIHDIDNPASLSNSGITNILEDYKGSIWIGTWYGLNRYNKLRDNFIRYENDPDDPKSLSHNLVWSIYEDSKKMIWFGTDGGGVCVMDPKISAFKVFKHNPNDTNTICHNRVFIITETRGGIIWFGTANGLSSYDRVTEKFKTYREENGLPHNQIASIIEDNNGILWLSSERGLTSFNHKTGIFSNYTKKDGLKDLEFTARAAVKDIDGKIYFGGKSGVVYFDPENIINKSSDAPMVITNLKIYNQTVSIRSGRNSILKESIITSKSISIPYDDDVITIEYALLYYSNPRGNKFYYKLSGFENNWNSVGTRTSATYTNLPPGEYTFMVKATNSDGIKSKNVASIEVIIVPAFYQNLWFQALLVIGILITIALFFQVRTLKVKKVNKLLENKVTERTKDLDKTITELNLEVIERKKVEQAVQASLEEKEKLLIEKESLLAEKEILLKEIHHRVKNNLQIISSLLYLQSQSINDENTVNMFEDSRNRIASMALIHEKLYQSEDFIEINFYEYVDSLLAQLKQSFLKDKSLIKDYILIDKNINLNLDTAISCGLIVNELTTNSYKHAFPSERFIQKAGSEEPRVEVKVNKDENDNYEMIVGDNGIGLPEDLDIDNISSLGLKIVTSMVAQMNGTIEVYRNNGTQFKIKFSNIR